MVQVRRQQFLSKSPVLTDSALQATADGSSDACVIGQMSRGDGKRAGWRCHGGEVEILDPRENKWSWWRLQAEEVVE